MEVLLPIVAAQKMCRELVACSAILIYWILMRMLGITHRYDTDLAAIRDIATNMKYLWVEVSQLLFTLKVHVSSGCDHHLSLAVLLSACSW